MSALASRLRRLESTLGVVAGEEWEPVPPLDIAHRAGIVPDPWQRSVLTSPAMQILLLCCRQAGKSTTTALLAADELLNRPPALVLLLAPALRQAQELFRKVRHVLRSLGPTVPAIVQESTLSLELATGSRVVCLPGSEDTVRGYSNVALLVVDEAARADDALYAAVRPMLAVSGGRIVLLSTPWGQRGFFWQEFTQGSADWHRVKVTAHECPRISPEWLEAERQSLPDPVFRSEYLCEFLDVDEQVFATEIVLAALSKDVQPLFGAAA